MNAAQALGPGSAQEFCQNGFGLVVASVGGCHGFYLAGGHQLPEPPVTQTARGLLDSFGWLGGCGVGLCLGFCVHLRFVKGQAKVSRERARKGQIGVGLLAAQAVVQMGGVQHQAQFAAPLGQRAQQGNGVRAAGETNSHAKSGPEQFRVDG